MFACAILNGAVFCLFASLTCHFFGQATKVTVSKDERKYISDKKALDAEYLLDREN